MEEDRVLLAHGAGGRLTAELIADRFLPALAGESLAGLGDAALVETAGGRVALTTDSYVVTPRFFPGGDLGLLAVCGTVNDLAVAGAKPRYLTASFILEEGLPMAELEEILASMARAAREAGVEVVAGDTKVVPRGACDGVFITTAGMGDLPPGPDLHPRRIKRGDRVVCSGTIGDHGVAVMNAREGLALGGKLRSDVAPLAGLIACLRKEVLDLRVMRDPTRGGVGQALYELAMAGGVRVVLDEASLPVRSEVAAACDLLGLDPLYVANEGKLVAFVSTEDAARTVELMRSHRHGANAAVIGRVVEGEPGVELNTMVGGCRTIRPMAGDQLPRIC